ncbi:unnamed protein product [Cylindrotheca closterium]|uniref:Uncharacterized protein n=1 Tax=Cylindrotheca closterium TaxID=2856 RepID=A0AAD2JGN3_9STRA|nr:unnamed protein product [Cylindrotheca closterium]
MWHPPSKSGLIIDCLQLCIQYFVAFSRNQKVKSNRLKVGSRIVELEKRNMDDPLQTIADSVGLRNYQQDIASQVMDRCLALSSREIAIDGGENEESDIDSICSWDEVGWQANKPN